MELRHLRYFVAVAEELHFGHAAARLHMAQPPLSMQIKQLESEIGFRLFQRTNRKVELTQAGALLLDDVRELLAELDRSVASAKRVARGEAGWLGIGFVGSATYAVLPAALQRFREEHPDVELVLRELVSAKQAQALREGRIHVGLARPAIGEDGFESEVILNERLVAALPDSHPLAKNRRLRIEDLAREPFILFPQNPKPSYADFVLGICEQAGFVPRIVQEAAEMHTAIGLVAAGLGVTLVPGSVRTETRPGLTFRDLAGAPSTALTAAYRSADESPVLVEFLRILRGLAQTGEQGPAARAVNSSGMGRTDAVG